MQISGSVEIHDDINCNRHCAPVPGGSDTQVAQEGEDHLSGANSRAAPLKSEGDQRSVMETRGDQRCLTVTHEVQHYLSETHGDQRCLTETRGDQRCLSKTHGDQRCLTETHRDQCYLTTQLMERPWLDIECQVPELPNQDPGFSGPSSSLWRAPLRTAAALFLVVLLYSVCRDVLQPSLESGRSQAYRLPVLVVNRALPGTAISLLALAHLPDVLASVIVACTRSSRRCAPPHWLARWLAVRAHLWLLGAGGAALHVVYSLSYPGRISLRYKMLAWSYKQVQEGRESSWDEEDVWRMEVYVSLGVLSLGVISLLGVAHVPAVRDSLTAREAEYLHDRLGPLGLLLSAAHTAVYGWRRWLDAASYVWWLPPVFLLALLVPCCTLLGMALTTSPCRCHRPVLCHGDLVDEEEEEKEEDERKDQGHFHKDQAIRMEMVTAF